MKTTKLLSLINKLTIQSTPAFSRCFSSLSHSTAAISHESPVIVEEKSNSRTAVLYRPHALNSLNLSVATRLLDLYTSWEDDPDIGFVMNKGSGRAFCAGGDLVTLYRQLNEGKLEASKEFFRTLYTFIYILGTYLKPHVALLNGVTMGGGGGVSIPGTFRVATDKTVFATPETLIGFHPDAGASFYLSHLPGHIGEYLALTSEKLSGAEMVTCGLATHYSLSAKLPQLEEQLGSLVTNDFSVVETTLQEFSDVVAPDNMSVLHRLETLNECFSHDTVEEIIDCLENEAAKTDHAWCASTLKRLREVSPLSLKISLRSIREGRYQTLDECLAREYRMTIRSIKEKVSADFREGIRARMVDRDFSPKWDPPSLDRVSEDMVDHYFSPLSDSEQELELPTKLREAFP